MKTQNIFSPNPKSADIIATLILNKVVNNKIYHFVLYICAAAYAEGILMCLPGNIFSCSMFTPQKISMGLIC